ncbi:conserved hypothetical protein [Rhodococcus ruber]|uniref:Uncharacterized protein n=2 Tax=Nocardiaceae TaxID=85025 RepID=A0A098BUE6_9NOCA|nr:conserved hypothetical protein [Rhodococcus ruber]
MNLGWYAHRLGSMSAPEVVWRLRGVGRTYRSGGRYGVPTDSELLGSGNRTWSDALSAFREGAGGALLFGKTRAEEIADRLPLQVEALIRAAERTCENRFEFFADPEVRLDTPIDWWSDPLRGVQWPSKPAHRIDHRRGPGDPKWIWELNRLQHLPWLASARMFTGEERFATVALSQLDSWIARNPPGWGIAWRGAFEAGIRSISVALTLDGLRDAQALTEARFARAVRMLAAGAERCLQDRSRFSSANNHLVGELAGPAIVALLLPELRHAARWEADAVAALAVEADRQILPDGAGAEQALGYQVFVVELLTVVAAVLFRRYGHAPDRLTAAIFRSREYLEAVIGECDPEPHYGDDDQGFAVRLGPEPRRTVREHLGIVDAFLADRPAGAVESPESLTAAWLSSARPVKVREQITLRTTAAGSAFAPDGGMAVLRSGPRTILMDVGALGYLSIAAHGHSDALAMSLNFAGESLIGDPGTGSYYRNPEWREAHRSTRAHATACVDGLDQSVRGGPFLWMRHAQVRVREIDLLGGIVDAEHDGYRRLPAPVVHRRRVMAPPTLKSVLVLDLFTGRGRHDVHVSWPMAPDLEVEPAGAGHRARRRGVPVLELAYAVSGGVVTTEAVRGDDDSALGWWSRELEHRVPAWAPSVRCHADLPFVCATVLLPFPESRAPGPHAVVPARSIADLRVDVEEGRVQVEWIDLDGPHRVAFEMDRVRT